MHIAFKRMLKLQYTVTTTNKYNFTLTGSYSAPKFACFSESIIGLFIFIIDLLSLLTN